MKLQSEENTQNISLHNSSQIGWVDCVVVVNLLISMIMKLECN